MDSVVERPKQMDSEGGGVDSGVGVLETKVAVTVAQSPGVALAVEGLVEIKVGLENHKKMETLEVGVVSDPKVDLAGVGVVLGAGDSERSLMEKVAAEVLGPEEVDLDQVVEVRT